MRRAVILAAGVGQRLRPKTDDRPKVMLDLGGEPILSRLARQLAAVDVDELVLATGWHEETIAALVPKLPMRCVLRRNDAYDRTQNVVSLHVCSDALLSPPRETLQLDGDLIFDDRLLPRLCAAPMRDDELLVAVDRKPELGLGDEEMKVLVSGERVVRFGKGLDPKASAGESIGVARVGAAAVSSVLHAVGGAVTRGDTGLYYEDVWNELLGREGEPARPDRVHARVIDVSDLAWTEIDTHEDLARAEAIAARLASSTPR